MSFLDHRHDNLFIIIFNYLFWLYWAFVAVLDLSLVEVMVGVVSLVVIQGFLQLPRAKWDLNSSTRDRTCIPCIGRLILNHWTTREVPKIIHWKQKGFRVMWVWSSKYFYFLQHSATKPIPLMWCPYTPPERTMWTFGVTYTGSKEMIPWQTDTTDTCLEGVPKALSQQLDVSHSNTFLYLYSSHIPLKSARY